ncbi:MAG: sensor histidine kinase, partial [Clostridia bacterium]|nr:sensor histidine kinase [Clostridia bacterium]
MKFWQKIFISSIILFVIVFNVGAYFIVSYSYEFTLQREKESSIREQTVILSSINTSIKNYEKAL